MNKIYWYELCFYGDEDDEGKDYDKDKACSYVIKTEIPPVINQDTALKILFGKDLENPEEERMKDLISHCTCVMNVSEDEAGFFDVEGLTIRVDNPELGVYYKRP